MLLVRSILDNCPGNLHGIQSFGPFRVVFFVGFLVLSIQAVAELIRAVHTLLNPTNIANVNSNG